MSPRRTLAQAREVLERDLVPRISDHWRHEYTAALERAEATAREVAGRRVADLERQVVDLRNEALRELAETRDELEPLRGEIAIGHEPAGTYAVRLADLRGRQQGATRMLSDAEDLVQHAEEIEADPVAFFDRLVTKVPRLMPELPF